MPAFHVTYDVVTPESAEHGDYSECGFIGADGSKTPLGAADFGEQAGKIKAAHAMPLRDALRLINAGCMEDSGSWFSECDGREDYRTGESERRSLHCPDGITAASYARISRLVCMR